MTIRRPRQGVRSGCMALPLIAAVPCWGLLAKRRKRPESTMQYAAFRGLMRMAIACAAIAVLAFVLAAFSDGDPGPFIGFGILMASFVFFGAIPTWAAWQKRHSDEP